MKTLTSIVYLLLISTLCFSFISLKKDQTETGQIDFKEISLKKAKQLAKKEKKSIFIYFHAKWCGPCKSMAKTTFKDKEVISLFNKEFISVKMDVDQGDEVKKIAMENSINSIPTYLILTSDGKVINKSGGYLNASDFLSFAKAKNK